MISLGFVLSLAATAASLVPIYLQKPIIDNIVAPFQLKGERHFQLVPWYLSAMAGAAILTFLLAWARNYVLAWVSERIAADLRNTTYTHLQRLSLEFFGGKRTGDLISRVSTRHGTNQYLPLRQSARFRQRRAHDPDDGGHHVELRSAAGPGHALPAAVDRLAGATVREAVAGWISVGEPGLGAT